MFPSRRVTLGGDIFRDEYSLEFDGTDDKLSTTVPSSTFHGDFSLSAWVKRIDVGSAGDIADGRAGDDDGFALFFRAGDTLRATFDALDVTTGADFGTANIWYHIAAVYTDSTATGLIYVDGVETADGTGTSNLNNTNNTLDIGDAFQGNISDVAIYNTPLTASQVATIYNGREPYNHKEGIASGSLVGWWRMGDGTERGAGTTVYDMSANSNNGTMTNFPAGAFKGDTP